MPKLTVRRGDATWTIPFESGQRLDEVLIAHDLAVPRPCGGRGVCGKCAVELSGQVSAPNAAERRAGRRLSCQALLMGDALAVLPDDGGMEQIATPLRAPSSPRRADWARRWTSVPPRWPANCTTCAMALACPKRADATRRPLWPRM